MNDPLNDSLAHREEEVKRIFSHTAKSYEWVVSLTTLGMDHLWKRRMIAICRHQVKSPKNILDLACGTGLLTFELAKIYPDATIVGLDIMPEYLEVAKSKVESHQKKDRILFYQYNADQLESADLKQFEKFDLILSSYLPKYIDFPKLVVNCHNLLAPSGLMLMHDFTRPRWLILRLFYNAYWLFLSTLLQFSHSWREMGKQLKDIIWRSHWTDEFGTIAENLSCRKITTLWQPFQVSCIAYFIKDRQ